LRRCQLQLPKKNHPTQPGGRAAEETFIKLPPQFLVVDTRHRFAVAERFEILNAFAIQHDFAMRKALA